MTDSGAGNHRGVRVGGGAPVEHSRWPQTVPRGGSSVRLCRHLAHPAPAQLAAVDAPDRRPSSGAVGSRPCEGGRWAYRRWADRFPVCSRLVGAGYEVIAGDRRPERAPDVRAAGAGWRSDVPEVAAAADVLITVLPAPGAAPRRRHRHEFIRRRDLGSALTGDYRESSGSIAAARSSMRLSRSRASSTCRSNCRGSSPESIARRSNASAPSTANCLPSPCWRSGRACSFTRVGDETFAEVTPRAVATALDQPRRERTGPCLAVGSGRRGRARRGARRVRRYARRRRAADRVRSARRRPRR